MPENYKGMKIILKARFAPTSYHNIAVFNFSNRLKGLLESFFNCAICSKRKVKYFLKVKNGSHSFYIHTVNDFQQMCQEASDKALESRDVSMMNALDQIHNTECVQLTFPIKDDKMRVFNVSSSHQENVILQIENNFSLSPTWTGWQIHSCMNSISFHPTKSTLRDDLIMTSGLREILKIHSERARPLQDLCCSWLTKHFARNFNHFCQLKNLLHKSGLTAHLKKHLANLFARYIQMRRTLRRKEELELGDVMWKYGSDDRFSVPLLCFRCAMQQDEELEEQTVQDHNDKAQMQN